MVRLNGEKTQYSHLLNNVVVKSVWDMLEKVHGVKGKGKVHFLMHNFKASPEQSTDNIATELESIQQDVADTTEAE